MYYKNIYVYTHLDGGVLALTGRLTCHALRCVLCSTQRRWADDLTWEDIKFFRKLTDMKLCLKGVQCAEDALLAYKAGVDGIVVSNHGGRNCDTARPSLEVLVEVMPWAHSAFCSGAALRCMRIRPPRTHLIF